MENYNGIAISKNDKEFVVAFDNFVNGKMQSATNTGKALATIHRYLQSQAFKVCVAYFRQLAVNYRTGYYDERNETAARRAAMMYDTLMNGDEIYDPKNARIVVKVKARTSIGNLTLADIYSCGFHNSAVLGVLSLMCAASSKRSRSNFRSPLMTCD